MKVIFCEECGGKNVVDPELLKQVADQPIVCQICGNTMSQETIIPHLRSSDAIDTLQYHLLFVDDDLFHLQLMKKSLEKEYTVSIASTGKYGLEQAEALQPDLILLDVNMPGMDGYEVCKRLKEGQATRHIPVMFVSARIDGEDESQGFALGAVDYINKPINLPILNARIGVQLRLKYLLSQQTKQAEGLIKSLQTCSVQAETQQETLEQQKNNFIAILNSMPERVSIEDTEKQVIWANKAAQDSCARPLSDIIGSHCHDIHQGSDSVCEQCPVQTTSLNDLHGAIEMSPKGDGSASMQVHLPLFDEEGNLKGIAHIVTDRTDGAQDTGGAAPPAPTELSSFLEDNRHALLAHLSTILFGVDAVSSMCRKDKNLIEVGGSISNAATELDSLIRKLIDFYPPSE